MKTKLKTAPATTPISVSDAKTYLRIDNNIEDGMLELLIKSAVEKLESYTDLKFITQTWEVYLDAFPNSKNEAWWDGTKEGAINDLISQSSQIVLPIGPGISLDEFETFGDDGVPVVSNVSDFIFDDVGPRCSVSLKQGGLWPLTILRASNGIRFEITCGFGSAVNVPNTIKMAILTLVAYMYENRGDQKEITIPNHVLNMVESYRRNKVGN